MCHVGVHKPDPSIIVYKTIDQYLHSVPARMVIIQKISTHSYVLRPNLKSHLVTALKLSLTEKKLDDEGPLRVNKFQIQMSSFFARHNPILRCYNVSYYH